jgi:predicted transport protein
LLFVCHGSSLSRKGASGKPGAVHVEIKPQISVVRLYLKVDPDRVELEDGFMRDVRQVGHFGTGDLEVTIRNNDDLARAMPFIRESYENS